MQELLTYAERIDMEKLARLWKTVAGGFDINDAFTSPVVLEAPTKAEVQSYGNLYEREANKRHRSLVLQGAVSTFAKGLEAAEAAVSCRESGLSSASLLLSYDAAFFCARSLTLFSGISPTDANSEVSVDVWYSFRTVAKKNELLEDNFAYFVGQRWEHQNLWSLLSRIVSKTKRTTSSEPFLKILRSDKLKNVSNIRNKQSYSTKLYAGDLDEECDFPDKIDVDPNQSAIICARYSSIFRATSALNWLMIKEAELNDSVNQVVSLSRKSQSLLL